jgi:hypothetical protein
MGLSSAFTNIAETVMRKAVPELAERGTAEAPTILERARLAGARDIGQRGKTTPFLGEAETLEKARATKHFEPWTLDRVVQGLRTGLGSLFMAEPGVDKGTRKLAFKTRAFAAASKDRTDLMLRDSVFHHLKSSPEEQMNHLGDFMYFADEVANAGENASKTPSGIPMDIAKKSLSAYVDKVQKDPELQEAHKALRGVLDQTFDDMVNRGYIIPQRRRADYTPVQMLEEIATGLAEMRGVEAIGGKTFRGTIARGARHGHRETNILELTRNYISEYARKVAEDDMVVQLLNDPTLNFTNKFKPGDSIPQGLAVYRPGPGMPGYGRKELEQHFYEGFSKGVNEKSKNYMGGFVMPENVVKMLDEFRPKDADNPMYTAGQFWARQMTVYNPRNTVMNMLSDFPLALMGLPGEKAQPLGVIRFAPGAYKEAFKGAFGKESKLFDAARAEGLTSGTVLHSVEGRPGSLDFSRFQSAEAKPPMRDQAADFLRRTRLAVEAGPRIAAGQAAAEAAGEAVPNKLLTLEDVLHNTNLNEFGRVGREITLPYGAGAPKATRYAVGRFIAPFMQFLGLSAARTAELVGTKGSQVRGLGALAIPTMGAMMWNNQDDEFKKIEHSLPDWERNQLHFIVKDPDTGKPYRDRTGKPVVLRFQYWVPEQVANTFGVGNFPSRVKRVFEGRDTWRILGESVLKQIPENAVNQIGPVRSLIELGLQKNIQTGQEKPFTEAVWSMAPVTRAFAETIYGFRNGGPQEALKRAAEEFGGLSVAYVNRKGKAVMDADLMDAQRKINDARKEFRKYKLRKDEARAADAKAKMMKAIDDLKRVAKARAKESKERQQNEGK